MKVPQRRIRSRLSCGVRLDRQHRRGQALARSEPLPWTASISTSNLYNQTYHQEQLSMATTVSWPTRFAACTQAENITSLQRLSALFLMRIWRALWRQLPSIGYLCSSTTRISALLAHISITPLGKPTTVVSQPTSPLMRGSPGQARIRLLR